MGNSPLGGVLSLQRHAATPLAGYTLVNGTGNVLSWTAPADGNLHRFIIFADLYVMILQVGGEIEFTYTAPNGDTVTVELFPPNQGVGPVLPGNASLFPLAPGGTVTVTQTSALTAGAANMWAEIWAS